MYKIKEKYSKRLTILKSKIQTIKISLKTRVIALIILLLVILITLITILIVQINIKNGGYNPYKGWIEYDNTFCNYSFNYPYNWDVNGSLSFDHKNRSCDTGTSVEITSLGYTITFTSINYLPVERVSHFDHFNSLIINNQKFIEGFLDNCTNINLSILNCKTYSSSYFSMIVLDNAADLKNHFINSSFYLKNGKLCSIIIRTPFEIDNINDSRLKKLLPQINMILESMKFQ